MKMKVVAIQGSPHRGNTYERVERFGEALEALGDDAFEHVALKDVDIEPCRGCFLCFEWGEDACPLKDDKAEIERKLGEADGVVFATPVYSMHISYLLKRFVDRSAYTFQRPRYFGKFAVGLAVAAGVGLDEALNYIKMFASTWEFAYLGDLRYTDPPRNTKLPAFAEEEDRTDELAGKPHRAMKEKPPREVTLGDYMLFHCMRAVYARMESFSPADYAYWKERGWLEPGARYFTAHAKWSFLKSLYPRFVGWMLGRGVDKRISEWRASGKESGGE